MRNEVKIKMGKEIERERGGWIEREREWAIGYAARHVVCGGGS